MPSKSTTVTIVRKPVKRHSIPSYWQGTSQRKHDWPSTYGNGSDGKLRQPANRPSQSQSK